MVCNPSLSLINVLHGTMFSVYEKNWDKRRMYYLARTAKGLTMTYYLSMLQTLIRTSNAGPQCQWDEPLADLGT